MYINSHVIVERYSELFIDVPNSAIILEIPIQICKKMIIFLICENWYMQR